MPQQGGTPIDGIFVPTDFIPVIHSGYLMFGEGIPSNHQVVWVIILLETMGWFKAPDRVPLKARCLKCEDPRIIKRNLQALKEELSKQNTCQWLEELVQQAKGQRLTQAQQHKLEVINSETTTEKLTAEN